VCSTRRRTAGPAGTETGDTITYRGTAAEYDTFEQMFDVRAREP
jgi:hypothetical protein